MTYESIISTHELVENLDNPEFAIFDCRFSLGDTEKGQWDYVEAHIPGAVYAHLDKDLCAPVIPGRTGRHPLPEIDQLVEKFTRWGIGTGVQVVAYDDYPEASGAFAARLWWTLRYLGHHSVAVLDGGWERWRDEKRPVRSGLESRESRVFQPNLRRELLATSADVDSMRRDPAFRVFDSRAIERYHGKNETIDPVAGHIPGAISAPFAENMGTNGLFLAKEILRNRFQTLLGDVPAENAVFYCGSGVTAAHNVLAMKYSGLGEPRLYVGSWSEWITDPARPVTK